MRRRFLYLLLAVAGCGPSFRSVRETAALGERVGAGAPVLLHGPRTCALLLRATSPEAAPARCAAQHETAQVMVRAARLLGAYGSALRDLAMERHLSLGSLLDLVGNSKATVEAQAGGSLAVSSAGKKLSALITLASERWRRQELGRVLVAAQPHVVAVAEGLRLHLRLQREALRSLRGGDGERGLLTTLSGEIQAMGQHLRCGERDTTCRSLLRFGPLGTLGLVLVEAWAEEQEGALLALERSLAAFLAAHEVMARRAATPGGLRDDVATYEEIRERLRQLSPLAENPEAAVAGPGERG